MWLIVRAVAVAVAVVVVVVVVDDLQLQPKMQLCKFPSVHCVMMHHLSLLLPECQLSLLQLVGIYFQLHQTQHANT